MRSRLVAAIACAGLLTSTTAAAARPAEPVAARSQASLDESDQLAGSLMIVGLIAVAAVIAILVLLDDDDNPQSP